jgi:hypothetical protein
MEEESIKDIKKKFEELALNPQYNYPKSRKWIGVAINNRPKTEWSTTKYQKEFNKIIRDAFTKLKDEHIKWLTESNINLLNDLSNITEIFDNYSEIINTKILKLFYIGRIGETYTKDRKVIKRIDELTEENRIEFIKGKSYRNISLLMEKLNDIKSMKILESRINKWSFDKGVKDNLTGVIQSILNISSEDLNDEDKQITIEKAIFEYDFNYYNDNIDNKGNKFMIYSHPQGTKCSGEYINMENNYENFMEEYRAFRAIKFKILFNKDEEKNYAILLLILFYIGKERLLPFILKQVLNKLLGKLQGFNKTHLLFSLGENLIKSLKIIDKFEVSSSINKICSIDELKILINKVSTEDKIKLGEIMYSILGVGINSKLIIENAVRISLTNTEIIVNINPDYIKNIITSNVQMSQLPMIARPRPIKENGDYYPYLLPNTNIINIDECKAIKGKYDQKFKTKETRLFGMMIIGVQAWG